MEFLEKHRQQQAERATNARAELDGLIQAAAVGTLSDRDGKRLVSLAGELGISLEAVEADQKVLQRAKDLEAVAATVDERRKVFRAKRDELQARKMEIREYERLREEDLREQGRWVDRHYNEMIVAEAAARDLKVLREQHHHLLKAPDPAIEARKRHLIFPVLGGENPPGLQYSVVHLVPVLMDPAALLGHSLESDASKDLIWVPVSGQSPEELQYLVGFARESRNLRAYRLICLTDDADAAPPFDGFGRVEKFTVDGFIEAKVNPSRCKFIQWPGGQTAAQLAELVAIVKKAEAWLEHANPRERAWR